MSATEHGCCEHERYFVNVQQFAAREYQRNQELERLLRLARAYVAHGEDGLRRAAYCPVCRRKARVALQAGMCGYCVGQKIDAALVKGAAGLAPDTVDVEDVVGLLRGRA